MRSLGTPAWLPTIGFWQLSGLTNLVMFGDGANLASAIGAVACSAPSLTHLRFSARGSDGTALPPICSASLKRITALYWLTDPRMPPQPIKLTFLAGCTQLQEVHVQFRDKSHDTLENGASVQICCHCNSQRCIVPCVGHAELIGETGTLLHGVLAEVGVRFLLTPASPQGVQAYTVLSNGRRPDPSRLPSGSCRQARRAVTVCSAAPETAGTGGTRRLGCSIVYSEWRTTHHTGCGSERWCDFIASMYVSLLEVCPFQVPWTLQMLNILLQHVPVDG